MGIRFQNGAVEISSRRQGRAASQCREPRGWLGRLVLRNMNLRHSGVTDWGLGQIAVRAGDTVLDVGCGGGRTLAKLAGRAPAGTVYGVDHSPESVRVAGRVNRAGIAAGRVVVREASVMGLPFPAATFDLVTAVETHFWWPDLASGLREIHRVLKPGGTVALIAEIHKGAPGRMAAVLERKLPATGLQLLSVQEHRAALADAGFHEATVTTQGAWICATGRRTEG
ncbi:MAG TPA: class I SAM-dependent methyltransferase [Terriglobales bacterium]|nr:class I SAM-dependent methyltransferase [Terriglobales bacterium]